MSVRPHKGKEPGPDLPGRYYTYTLDAAFLVSEPASAAVPGPAPAANGRLPFVLMHMRKPPLQTRVLAREPTSDTAGPARLTRFFFRMWGRSRPYLERRAYFRSFRFFELPT